MANRYLVGSGNWSGPVWATTINGAAGSAATPTSADTAIIIGPNTVTLTSDTLVSSITHAGGTFNMNGYDLTVTSTYQAYDDYVSPYAGNRTLKMGSGTLTVNGQFSVIAPSHIGGTYTTTVVASTSRLVINVNSGITGTSHFGDETYNDVIYNLTSTVGGSVAHNISGSPTFRSLIIRSDYNAPRTINFDDHAQIIYEKLVLVGPSSSNRLLIKTTSSTPVYFDPSSTTSTAYGQYVNMYDGDTTAPTINAGPYYIGSNSIQGGGAGGGWLTQDPPKISTLVDPLTATPTSNTNWTVSGTINKRTDGLGGGGYSSTSGAKMTSTDTYDLIGSKFVFERSAVTPTGDNFFGVSSVLPVNSIDTKTALHWESVGGANQEFARRALQRTTDQAILAYSYPITDPKYQRIDVSESGYFTMAISDDGVTWNTAWDGYLDDTDMLLMRSTRIRADWFGISHIGSIGMLPATPASPRGNWLPFFI